jgi:multiple sugar transport system ATP-binding protein
VTVDLREDMGSEIFLHFSVDAPHVATEDVREAVEDEQAVAAFEDQAVRVGTPFVARVGRESRAREGERAELAVDTRMLHFFDLDSGAAISR